MRSGEEGGGCNTGAGKSQTSRAELLQEQVVQ